MTRLVVVDDDALFRESLAANLRDSGFEVIEFESGEGALAALEAGASGDLLLLDWKMPGLSGIELLRRLRDNAIDTPAIFLTSLGGSLYEETALTSGAVDYVDKSRSLTVILKRIELILAGRKSGGAKAAESDPQKGERKGYERKAGGALELDLTTHRARWRGKPVDLTLTEFRMLERLVRIAGQDVGYRELYDLVHGDGFVAGEGTEGYRTNVRAFVKRIRQKFRDVDPQFDGIANYAGFGYRWIADD